MLSQKAETGAKDHQHDHIGDDEVSELNRPPSIYEKVREQAERFASTRLGQYAIERADNALKLIEDTTKWSLPQERNSNNVILERPLPWLPFLLLIVALRMTRMWLSVGALLIGNSPISPTDVISFIRVRRRKLRAVRIHGLRVMRCRQQEASSCAGKSLTQKLSQWLSQAICRPGVQRENSGRLLTVPQLPKLNATITKSKDCEADQNLSFQEMLSKYVNENSEDDSDYVPNPDDSSSSSSSSSSESESHSSEAISDNEAKEHAKQVVKPNHVENGVQHNNKKDIEQNLEQEKLVKSTATSNGNNEKEQTEVAQLKPSGKDDWKATPGHLSAAAMNTRLYNNTAAAANTDTIPNSESTSQPDTDNDNEDDSDNETNTDTDSSCTNTVCHKQLPAVEPEPEDSQLTTITASTEYTNVNTALTNESNQIHPTVDTLTPATSSEDIFYSPIGSPHPFNTCYATDSPLKNVTINGIATHSTPNSELEDIHTSGSELEETAKLHISMAQAESTATSTPVPTGIPSYKPQQQQQQRQFNQANQRFRGRNRR